MEVDMGNDDCAEERPLEDEGAANVHRIKGCFNDMELERQFRDFIFQFWRKSYFVAVHVLFLIVITILIVYCAFIIPVPDYRGTGFFGDQLSLGAWRAHLTNISPAVLTLLVMICIHTRLYSARNFPIFLACTTFGVLFGFGWPVHVADLLAGNATVDPALGWAYTDSARLKEMMASQVSE
tara:strand:- start:72 stop:614 length:543 start_codon:yes stop_codon:yes gene_type:complete